MPGLGSSGHGLAQEPRSLSIRREARMTAPGIGPGIQTPIAELDILSITAGLGCDGTPSRGPLPPNSASKIFFSAPGHAGLSGSRPRLQRIGRILGVPLRAARGTAGQP